MTFKAGKRIEVKSFFKYFMQMTFKAGKRIEVKSFFKYFMQMTFKAGKRIEVKPFFKYFMQMSFAKTKKTNATILNRFWCVLKFSIYFLFILQESKLENFVAPTFHCAAQGCTSPKWHLSPLEQC